MLLSTVLMIIDAINVILNAVYAWNGLVPQGQLNVSRHRSKQS
jgi:hypothetical protein